MPTKAYKQIAYHRVSDDSVTSFTVPVSSIEYHKERITQNWDIDHVWTRDDNDEVDWDSDKEKM